MDCIKQIPIKKRKVCEQYIVDVDEGKSKYGTNTVVYTQVGDFYELYSVKFLDDGEEVLHQYMLDVHQKTGLEVKPVQKTKQMNSRPVQLYMAGFPLVSLDKYINIMVDNYGYNVIIVNQTKSKNELGKEDVNRNVYDIITPGTYYNDSKSNSNVLMSIFLDLVKSRRYKSGFSLYAGISSLDCITGKSYVKQIDENYETRNILIDEIRKFVSINNPKEIIIYHEGFNQTICIEDLVAQLNIDNRYYHLYDKLPSPSYVKQEYQNSILEKVFQPATKISISQYLGLEEYDFAKKSYVLLLNFVWDRLPNLIQELDKPEIVKNNYYLSLANDSLEQLRVVYDSGYFKKNNLSLLNHLDKTTTAIGRRAFRHRLLNPIKNIDELETRYMQIEIMLNKSKKTKYKPQKNLIDQIKNYLMAINDIERLGRRMASLRLSPSQFSGLIRTCYSIKKLINFINTLPNRQNCIKHCLPDSVILEQFDNFLEISENTLDLIKCDQFNLIYDINQNIFREGVAPELDDLQVDFDKGSDLLEKVEKSLTDLVYSLIGNKTSNPIKRDFNASNKHHLTCSPSTWKVLKEQLNEMTTSNKIIKLGNTKIKPSDIKASIINKSKMKLDIKCISDKSHNMMSIEFELRLGVQARYNNFMKQLYRDYHLIFGELTKFIGEIDVIKTCALNVIDYNYHIPTIDDTSEDGYIIAEKIRHPLIERINQKVRYIPHDITVGTDGQNGILLFGANATGKSACMKSIGLNLIMAQAGMYVACQNFTYRPYDYLFTRIEGNDDIQRSKSSFEVEMSEFKTILDNMNNRSIILGDELCRGTENISGTAIVAAGICYLSKVNASFIFASHLHSLDNVKELKELDNVKFKHLTVIYDEKNNKLIYDRQIKDGIGATTYGLEVCRALSMDKGFLDLANQIRKDITGQSDNIVSIKASNYNSKVFQDTCSICGDNMKETHHIEFQSSADLHGNISKINSHKNMAHNLTALCAKCHDKVHNQEIKIKGYQVTSHGRELDYVL